MRTPLTERIWDLFKNAGALRGTESWQFYIAKAAVLALILIARSINEKADEL